MKKIPCMLKGSLIFRLQKKFILPGSTITFSISRANIQIHNIRIKLPTVLFSISVCMIEVIVITIQKFIIFFAHLFRMNGCNAPLSSLNGRQLQAPLEKCTALISI